MRSRRAFITLLGAAAAWPLAAHAQQPGMPGIGFLNQTTADAYPDAMAAFHAGLRETGFVENENVAIIYRWAENHPERLPALAADLVRRRVAVIAALGGGNAAFAAKAATTTIPIVFVAADDPVKVGLVASLNRPGGNLTGVSRLSVELMPKRLELLREVIPSATAVAYLIDPNSSVASASSAQEAARAIGVELEVIRVAADQDLAAAFARMAESGTKALLIGPSTYFNSRTGELGELSARHKLPAIYQERTFAAAGGLMSYGAPLADGYRGVGIYVGRVLKGDRPADLPVQQQTRVEFIINLKTAKALGLNVPLPLLGRADEVIE
jgi:putative tryptophan/tyrosine transport system substrate-binding protein